MLSKRFGVCVVLYVLFSRTHIAPPVKSLAAVPAITYISGDHSHSTPSVCGLASHDKHASHNKHLPTRTNSPGLPLPETSELGGRLGVYETEASAGTTSACWDCALVLLQNVIEMERFRYEASLRRYHDRLTRLRSEPRIKVAIYQPTDRHTEVIGPILELLATMHGASVDVFTVDPRDKAGFVSFFRERPHIFGGFDTYDAAEFDSRMGAYHLVYVTTAEDVRLLSRPSQERLQLVGVLVAHETSRYLRMRQLALLVVCLTPVIDPVHHLSPLYTSGCTGSQVGGNRTSPKQRGAVRLGTASERRGHRSSVGARAAAGGVATLEPNAKAPMHYCRQSRRDGWLRLAVVGWGNPGKSTILLLELLRAIKRRKLPLVVVLVTKGRGASVALKKEVQPYIGRQLQWQEACSMTALTRIMRRSRFVLPMLGGSTSTYRRWRLTGAVPLALSFGVPLLADIAFLQQHALQAAALSYRTSPTEALDAVLAQNEDEYKSLQHAIVEHFRVARAANRALLLGPLIKSPNTLTQPAAVHSSISKQSDRASAINAYNSIQLLDEFRDQFSGGGMDRPEQELLARTYTNAKSVFEWGMGSSTLVAAHVGIKRLTAVDSTTTWVEKVRAMLKHPMYTFRHADIGPVIVFGIPKDDAHKDQWPDYSLQVDQENEPFDVYLVDGRFRVACACRALLHGRADSLVLVHDFGRDEYKVLLTLADKGEQERVLVVLRRKPTTSDAEIKAVWEKYKFIQL